MGTKCPKLAGQALYAKAKTIESISTYVFPLDNRNFSEHSMYQLVFHRPLKIGLALLMIFLFGCTSTQVPQQEIDRQAHQSKLADYDHWVMKGRMAFKSPEEKFSAYMNWEQQEQVFQLNLNSFIGTSLMQMEGYPGFAKLEADDKVYTDKNASLLIKRITGWNIPVEKLALWVKGQVEEEDNVTVDQFGLVTSLEPQCENCTRWRLDYSKYKLVNDLWLPHQIELQNMTQKENQIKIRISSWQNSSGKEK